MNIEEKGGLDVQKLAQEHFVEAYANIPGCACGEGHRLHVALSETRARPVVYAPDHVGIDKAYCATHGRRCDK
jgi:hypothetical protein